MWEVKVSSNCCWPWDFGVCVWVHLGVFGGVREGVSGKLSFILRYYQMQTTDTNLLFFHSDWTLF